MFISVRSFIFHFFALIFISSLLFITLGGMHSQTFAQNSYTNPYANPNTNPDVPQNQHTMVQSVVIELLSSAMCLIAGVDPTNPATPCLGVDMVTNKIGYVQGYTNEQQIGGLLGNSTQLLSAAFIPPANTADYTQYLSNNFGLTKSANAQEVENGTGYDSLRPILGIWVAVRNIVYILFVLVFVIIGIAIMFRVKIDPRTVMTIQNQLPRIVVCIILVTFSYAIVGLLIDFMWVTTYFGINTITKSGNIDGETATHFLLDNPIAYTSEVYSKDLGALDGLKGMTWDVSHTMGLLLADLLSSVISGNELNCNLGAKSVGKFVIGHIPTVWVGREILQHVPKVSDFPFIREGGGGTFTDCIYYVLFGAVNWIASVVVFLIILLAILIALFRTWFSLIKAYAMIYLYTMAAPFFIMFGLIPGSSLGFKQWLRSLIAQLALFPATVALLLIAKVVMVTFEKNEATFIPPLTGNPNVLSNFGSLLGFGILMVAPELINQLRDSLKTPPNKYTSGAARQGLARGVAGPSAVAGGIWGEVFRRDAHGKAIGPGAVRAAKAWHTVRSRFRTP